MVFESILFWTGIGVAALCLIPYIYGPIRIRRHFTQPIDSGISPFTPDHPILIEPLQIHFRLVSERFDALGYEYVACLTQPAGPRARLIYLLFVQESEKLIGTAAALFHDAPSTELLAVWTDIVSWYRDHSLLRITTNQTPRPFPERAGVHTISFPDVVDPADLHLIHGGIADTIFSRANRVLPIEKPFADNGLPYFVKLLNDELGSQIQAGYFRRSEREGAYRTTWKGAWRLSWGMLFPFVRFHRARQKRITRDWLTKLRASGVLES
ncbi:MAG: hypothetical protein K8T89_06895 [Planctomycetes bacterium]|nr:hypothetical protein [Planctomycetota bacterium]